MFLVSYVTVIPRIDLNHLITEVSQAICARSCAYTNRKHGGWHAVCPSTRMSTQ